MGVSDRFPPNPRTRDGLSSWCRRCHAAAVQRWRERNPAKAASYNLARRVKHEPRPCTERGEVFVPGPFGHAGLLELVPVAPTACTFEAVAADVSVARSDNAVYSEWIRPRHFLERAAVGDGSQPSSQQAFARWPPRVSGAMKYIKLFGTPPKATNLSRCPSLIRPLAGTGLWESPLGHRMPRRFVT
jgi:hypothetical protein